jgi:hypothetical protein
VQKPYPPFVIGGSGEKLTLRIVAQYASVWNFVGGSVEDFQHKSSVLDQHCAEIGRDPRAIARSIQHLVNPNDLAASRDTIRPYIEAGTTHLILNLRYPYPEGIVHRLVEEIVEPLKAEFEGK